MEAKGDSMVRIKDLPRFLPLVLLAGVTIATEQPPYDEKVDAHQQIRAAIAEASKAHKNVILVFGANWCPDCRALDAQMHKEDLATLIATNYEVVKVDIGEHDKNQDIGKKYHVPLEHGIPALAVLNRSGKLLYAMDQGQFADARNMSYESIKAFFVKWEPKRKGRARRGKSDGPPE
jgi:protein disulfide-isomerase